MCTLVLLLGVVRDYPVVLLMNRDERYGRPSAGPALLPGDPPVVAPRDLAAGGTWIGVNGRGLVAALSNRGGDADPRRRSRGLLVLDLLRAHHLLAARAALEAEVRDRAYNPFNLLLADASGALYARWEGGRLDLHPLAPGVHGLANGDMDDAADPRVRRALDLVGPRPPRGRTAALRRLGILAGIHGDGPALCRHGVEAGTVSSTLLALHRSSPAASRLLFAPGPPGETPFSDCSALLALLAGGRGRGRRGRSPP